MENVNYVDNTVEIDVGGRGFAIPTGDNTKLTKYNEYTLDGLKTGFTDTTLKAKDSTDPDAGLDPETGLMWMAFPYIVFTDSTKKEVEVYVFTERPESIEIDTDTSIIKVTVAANGLVYKDSFTWANLTKDSDSDGRPDYLDPSVEGSIAWLYNSTEFNYNWQIKYALSSSVTTNDFSITADDIDIFPFAVSGGNRVFNSEGVRLTKEETVTVEGGGTVDIYDVKGLEEVRVRDAPGNNEGDCHVYDVVGETKTEVFSTDHVFVGYCEVTNGLLSFRFCADEIYTQLYMGSKYRNVYHIGISDLYTPVIVDMSADSVIVMAENAIWSQTIAFARGSHFAKLSNSPSAYLPTKRLVFSLSNMYYDQSVTWSSTSQDVDEFDDSIVLAFSPGDEYITYLQMTKADSYVYIDPYAQHFPDAIAYVGLLPIAPIYIEAEACTLSTGATLSTNALMYPGTGNTGVSLDAEGEYIEKTYTVGTDIDPYTYTLFIRAADSAQVADDLEVSVYDVTGEADTLAATTKTLTAAFDTPSVDFTITSAMNEHTIRIRAKKATATTNTIEIDYLLAVQAAEVEKQAKRSLAVVDTTKSILKLPR